MENHGAAALYTCKMLGQQTIKSAAVRVLQRERCHKATPAGCPPKAVQPPALQPLSRTAPLGRCPHDALLLGSDGRFLGAAQLLDAVLPLLHVLARPLHPGVQPILQTASAAHISLDTKISDSSVQRVVTSTMWLQP